MPDLEFLPVNDVLPQRYLCHWESYYNYVTIRDLTLKCKEKKREKMASSVSQNYINILDRLF